MPRNIIFLLQLTHLRCSDSIARHQARCSPAHTRTHPAAKSELALTRRDSRQKETGDQPKNWRATNPRTGGQRPKNRRSPLLFNLEGVLASCGNYTWVLSEVSAMWSTSPWPRSFHFGALCRVRGRLRFTTASTLASAKFFKVWPPPARLISSELSAHQMSPSGDSALAESSRTRAHGRRRPMSSKLHLAVEADPHA